MYNWNEDYPKVKNALEEKVARVYRVDVLGEDSIIGPTVRRTTDGEFSTIAFEYDVNTDESWKGHVDYQVIVVLDPTDWWRVVVVAHSSIIRAELLQLILTRADGLARHMNAVWNVLKKEIGLETSDH